MRLTKEELFKITGLQRPTAQVRWFNRHFGIDVPHDRFGPILTNDAYEALVRRKLGIPEPSENPPPQQRPKVRLWKQ